MVCGMQVLTDDMTEAAAAAAVGRHPVDEAAGCRVVVRNGVIDRSLSDLSALPDGVFVGSLADAPAEVSAQLVSISMYHERHAIPLMDMPRVTYSQVLSVGTWVLKRNSSPRDLVWVDTYGVLCAGRAVCGEGRAVRSAQRRHGDGRRVRGGAQQDAVGAAHPSAAPDDECGPVAYPQCATLLAALQPVRSVCQFTLRQLAAEVLLCIKMSPGDLECTVNVTLDTNARLLTAGRRSRRWSQCVGAPTAGRARCGRCSGGSGGARTRRGGRVGVLQQLDCGDSS